MKNELIDFLLNSIRTQAAKFDSSLLEAKEIYNEIELPELPDEIFHIAIIEAYKNSSSNTAVLTYKSTEKNIIESLTYSYLENLMDALAKSELGA